MFGCSKSPVTKSCQPIRYSVEPGLGLRAKKAVLSSNSRPSLPLRRLSGPCDCLTGSLHQKKCPISIAGHDTLRPSFSNQCSSQRVLCDVQIFGVEKKSLVLTREGAESVDL